MERVGVFIIAVGFYGMAGVLWFANQGVYDDDGSPTAAAWVARFAFGIGSVALLVWAVAVGVGLAGRPSRTSGSDDRQG